MPCCACLPTLPLLLPKSVFLLPATAGIAGAQACDLSCWGCLGRGLPAQGAQVLPERPWLCRPQGEVGLESLSCELGCPAPRPRAAGCWHHPSVLAPLPRREVMGCPVLCCPPLTGGMQSPGPPCCGAMTAVGLGVIPRGSPSVLGQGRAPHTFRTSAQPCGGWGGGGTSLHLPQGWTVGRGMSHPKRAIRRWFWGFATWQ